MSTMVGGITAHNGGSSIHYDSISGDQKYTVD